MLRLTPEAWNRIVEINNRVNRSTKYKSDHALYGQEDFWTIALSAGDCEDYALAKRRLLLDAGFPYQSIKLAICKDETGAGHAVLTVDTDRGTYVLDNRVKGVVPWKVLDYAWVARQGDGPYWEKIS